jgi:hypothetical protein
MTPVFLIGIGLILLGSVVAFGALFFQWGHTCPPRGVGVSCSSWGISDRSLLVPLPPSNPYSLPQYLPFVLFSPVLGVIIVALLLVTRGRRWDPVARAVLVFGGISVFCGFIGTLVTAYGIGFTDSAVIRVLDEGAIASLLAYAVALVGVICAFIGTPPRK